jgi:hypothetical protein
MFLSSDQVVRSPESPEYREGFVAERTERDFEFQVQIYEILRL